MTLARQLHNDVMISVLCGLALLTCSPHRSEGNQMRTMRAPRYEPWPGYWDRHQALIDSEREKGANTGTIREIEAVLTDWERCGLLRLCWEKIREQVSMRDVILVYESGNPNSTYYSCRAILGTDGGLVLITSPMIEDTSHIPDIRSSVVSDGQSRIILSQVERVAMLIKSDLSPDVDDPNISFLTVNLKGRANNAVFVAPEQSELRESRQLVRLLDSIFAR